MRVENSIKNTIISIFFQGFGLLINFIVRIFFIKILGSEYLGLNGLFTNILLVLSLAELGVGEAINFSLYKPLAEKDIAKCQLLMNVYKKVYIIIGIFITVIGIGFMPFIPYFINEMTGLEHVNIIYILFVLNTSLSYFFSYKRNLIIADQKMYIATIYKNIFYVIFKIAQIIYLIIFKDYIGYLVLQVLATVLENVFISIKAEKIYPFLQGEQSSKLDQATRNEIVKNTQAMMMHKIGNVIVNSTDNIILSKFVGLIAVGIYSNYYMITYSLTIVYTQIYASLTASIGNLCVDSSKDRQFDVFKKINFFTFWLYSFSAICLLILFNPFIELWVGKEYLLNFDVVIVICINFYVTGMRKSVLTFREAAGLFYKDRWKSVLEAIINLIVSIILAIKFGIIGVFIGTLISSIAVCVWLEPYILYKYGFEKTLILYLLDYFKKLFLMFSVAVGVYFYFSSY